MAEAKRRAYGEDGIYFDKSKGRYIGAVSLGYEAGGKRLRRKVSGRTKTEVKDKLKAMHSDLDAGVRTSASYTVADAVADWMREGRDGRAASTLRRDAIILRPVLAAIGDVPLHELTTHDVRRALSGMAASKSSATVALAHNCLERAIRHAESGDHVRRNVAGLVKPPTGQAGRPSRSLTIDQAAALLAAAHDSRIGAYVVLSLLTGIRTEEARALRWDHVDLDGDPDADPPVVPHMAVWRSVRAHGDTKTERSRRTLALSQTAIDALSEHRDRQADDRQAADELWQNHGLVFTTKIGTQLDDANVRREFRKITKAAGLGEGWAPRELRHSFVSLLSSSGVPVEEIARLAGHSSSRTTEVVYRRELRPVLIRGAQVMDQIFG